MVMGLTPIGISCQEKKKYENTRLGTFCSERFLLVVGAHGLEP